MSSRCCWTNRYRRRGRRCVGCCLRHARRSPFHDHALITIPFRRCNRRRVRLQQDAAAATARAGSVERLRPSPRSRGFKPNATGFTPDDSTSGNAPERRKIYELTAGARVIGFSEIVEGTHELPYIMRRALLALADSGVRGIALQASMADAMDVDFYVRGARGDLQRILRALNPPESQRIGTREMASLIEALRAWNSRNPNKQIGFYGFEIPTAAHAVSEIVSLPDSVLGAPLKAWLTQRYACVARNEGAHWGLEGRAADSTFWSSCGPETTQAMDSVIALHKRSTRHGTAARHGRAGGAAHSTSRARRTRANDAPGRQRRARDVSARSTGSRRPPRACGVGTSRWVV